jgi:hypothetical protein
MTNMLMRTIVLLVLAVTSAIAQADIPGTNTIWGQSVYGVQLSISLTNKVISVGSDMTITGRIRNASTNVIIMVETDRHTDFDVFLASDAGILYKLTNNHEQQWHFTSPLNLRAGEIRDWLISVTSRDWSKYVTGSVVIQAGEYTLMATRRFSTGEGDFQLESNWLTVQVK